MTTRLLLAVLVLSGLTAFAPAPFPRTQRGPQREELSLDGMQGTWNVLKLQTTQANGTPSDSGTYLKEVQIIGDRWTFVYREGRNNSVNYTITIDAKTKPPQLNFYSGNGKAGSPYGVGILRRDGTTVQLMYNWSGTRATSFEQPPSGHWLITLQRVR